MNTGFSSGLGNGRNLRICLAGSLVLLVLAGIGAVTPMSGNMPSASTTIAANGTEVKKQAQPDPLAFYSDWMMGYYLHPRLEQVVPSIQAFAKRGLFERGNYSIHIIVFYGYVFRQHPEKLQKWILQDLKDFKGDRRVSLMLMLWFANTEKARAILKTLRKETSPDEQALIDKTITEKPPDIVTLDLRPDTLDMCWSSFAATGDRRYVNRIIDALDLKNYGTPPNLPPEQLKKEREMNEATRQSAIWSLGSWVATDQKVLQIAREEMAKRPPEVAAKLKNIIQKNDPSSAPKK